MHFFLCKHLKLIAEYLLRIQDFLIVHFLNETVIFDAVRLEELDVGIHSLLGIRAVAVADQNLLQLLDIVELGDLARADDLSTASE